MRRAGDLAQQTRRFTCAVVALALPATSAFAADAPPLPASAKRLSGPAIVAIYQGKTFAFESFTFFGIVTGEVSYDFNTGTNRGRYQLGDREGTFGGSIRISGDKFCYQPSANDERCNDVYFDGRDIYEVRQSGIVESVKQAL